MIIKDKAIYGGKAIIQGTRLPVSSILAMLADGKTPKQIVKRINSFHKTDLKEKDIREALEYSITVLK